MSFHRERDTTSEKGAFTPEGSWVESTATRNREPQRFIGLSLPQSKPGVAALIRDGRAAPDRQILPALLATFA